VIVQNVTLATTAPKVLTVCTTVPLDTIVKLAPSTPLKLHAQKAPTERRLLQLTLLPDDLNHSTALRLFPKIFNLQPSVLPALQVTIATRLMILIQSPALRVHTVQVDATPPLPKIHLNLAAQPMGAQLVTRGLSVLSKVCLLIPSVTLDTTPLRDLKSACSARLDVDVMLWE
jgi:hypothetical protein